MTLTAEIQPGQLSELVRQLQQGDEMVLTVQSKPVAKLVPTAGEVQHSSASGWKLRSFKGHQVLTPNISHAEIAEEMFGRE